MGTVYIISVFLHIVFAAFWIGGMLFLPLVILPAVKYESNRTSLLYKTGIKFRFYGWIALIGLLTTGIYNMHAKGMTFTTEFLIKNAYGRLLGLKLSAFVLMIVIAGIHDFYVGNKAIEQMKENEAGKLKYIARWSGRINLMLALLIAFLGIALSRGGL